MSTYLEVLIQIPQLIHCQIRPKLLTVCRGIEMHRLFDYECARDTMNVEYHSTIDGAHGGKEAVSEV